MSIKQKLQNIGFGTILKIGLILLILVVIYTVYKKLQALFSTNKKAIQDDELQTQIEVKPNLPKPITYYENLADRQAQAMFDIGNSFTDSDEKTLSSLSSEELKQLFKSFGIRDHKNFGITTFTGNLFDWYEHELYRLSLGGKSQYERFKEIWKKSNLW